MVEQLDTYLQIAFFVSKPICAIRQFSKEWAVH